MKGISKLKDDARKYEQREEWDKAAKAYLQVLADAESGEIELPLYNRVGDLYVRLGRQEEAVRYYEQAADRYAEAGLYNNAIALCNKALRYVPGRLQVLRRLGQFSASQGFLTDARSYLMQFAEKSFAGGDTDAALAALADYANISGDAEIRELLGRKLHALGRTEAGMTELKRAYALRLGAGETEAAASLRRELLRIDPSALDDELAGAPLAVPPPVILPVPAEQLPNLEEPALPPEAVAEPAPPPGPIGSFAEIDELEPAGGMPELLEGFETTALEPAVPGEVAAELLSDLEPAREFETGAVELTPLEGLDATGEADLTGEPELPGLQVAESELVPVPPELADTGPLPDLELPLPAEEPEPQPLPLLAELPSSEPAGELLSEQLPELEGLDVAEDATPLPLLGEAEEPGPGEAEEPAPEEAEEPAPEEEPLPLLGEAEELAPEAAEELAPEAEPLPLLGEAEELAPEAAEEFAPEAEPLPLLGEAEEPATEAEPLPLLEEAEEPATEAEPLPLLGEAEEPAAEAEPLPLLGEAEEPAPEVEPLPLLEDVAEPAAPDTPAYVDLRALLAEPEPEPANTRFTVVDQPTGDEDDDFAALLSQFKRKVAQNVDPADAAAHYDLGLAFKDMGLLDEAIGELQVALHAGDMRLKVFEELGHCFLLKQEYSIAEKVLRRALETRYDDERELLGVYYHLGRACEELGKPDLARDAYERVLAIDIYFSDVSDRIARL